MKDLGHTRDNIKNGVEFLHSLLKLNLHKRICEANLNNSMPIIINTRNHEELVLAGKLLDEVSDYKLINWDLIAQDEYNHDFSLLAWLEYKID